MLTTGNDRSVTVARLDRSDGKMRGGESGATCGIQEERWAVEVQNERDAVRHSISPACVAPVVQVVLTASVRFFWETSNRYQLTGSEPPVFVPAQNVPTL